ncbi:cytochrome P450 26C1 [Mesocricetus auratus]|uniref:Cytochrome P450 26C1 n=1 Tax=Mesocricetus auratus TaxID=10036 RepID=A0A1U7Q5X6_MESAU|nr:cytochrome P450 26C1 [Mesocricetus auratus]
MVSCFSPPLSQLYTRSADRLIRECRGIPEANGPPRRGWHFLTAVGEMSWASSVEGGAFSKRSGSLTVLFKEQKPCLNLLISGTFLDCIGEFCIVLEPSALPAVPNPRRLAMFSWGLSCLSMLGATGTAVLCAGLLLGLAQHLWTLRWTLSRDRASALPLPKGSMGWPFFGETLHWLVQGSRFHSSRRERYGTVFKTHLLGRPVIRVSGAENVRTILLGEHRLVRSQWPQSAHILLGSHTLLGAVGEPHRQRRKVLARVFSRPALEQFVPRLQGALRREVRSWCAARGPVAVYGAAKALIFRMAARILLGLQLDEARCTELAQTFEQLVENLFSLPLDVPFSGLRKGIRARDQLYQHLDEAIAQKLHKEQAAEPGDALHLIINSARELGHELSVQELKESAVELLFTAFFTTASASTSLILLLLQHPAAVAKIQQELSAQGLGHACGCAPLATGPRPDCSCEPDLSLAALGRLRYVDCVVKEVLRLLPPVSGGYRTVLRTFELDGYQIPKGWSVMYSIRDTHETAAVYRSPPEGFDPERFGVESEDARGSCFHYIPFGGGARSCLGQKLARVMLKLLAVELVRTARWELATPAFPVMQTVPILHPVDGLRLFFHPLETLGAGDGLHL